MNTGDRIKKRRMELGLTVDDLAEKINKSRATIYRYENGDIENMPTTILEPLAKALYTTPADLMGWESQSESDYFDEIAQNDLNRQIDLLPDYIAFHTREYSQLTEFNRKLVDKYTTNLLSNQQMEEELTVQAARERTDIEVTDEMSQHDDDIMNDENF